MDSPWLSPAGRQRRDDILELVLHEAARRRTRKRHLSQAAALACTVCLLVIVSWWSSSGPEVAGNRPGPSGDHPGDPPNVATRSEPTDVPAPRIALVATDPSVVDRYVLRDTPPLRWATLIDDRQLVSELERMGRTSGLVRIGGQAWTEDQWAGAVADRSDPSAAVFRPVKWVRFQPARPSVPGRSSAG